MRLSLPVVIYLIVGVLVAAGVIGDANYFSGMNTIEEVVNMLLAVFLWPLVLLGVDFNIGGSAPGSGGGSGGGGSGASGPGGSGGGK